MDEITYPLVIEDNRSLPAAEIDALIDAIGDDRSGTTRVSGKRP